MRQQGNVEKLENKRLIAYSNGVKCEMYLKSTKELAMVVVFHRDSVEALNGTYIKKLMRAAENYVMEIEDK